MKDYRDRADLRNDASHVQAWIGAVLIILCLGWAMPGETAREPEPVADPFEFGATTYRCLREQTNGSLRFCTCERGKKVYKLRVNKRYKCPVLVVTRP